MWPAQQWSKERVARTAGNVINFEALAGPVAKLNDRWVTSTPVKLYVS